MVFTAKTSQILCIFAIFLSLSQSLSYKKDIQQLNKDTFDVRLYSELASNDAYRNIFFSPLSIKTCIAMTRMGAEGKTAREIDDNLGLTTHNPEDLADNYNALLAQLQNSAAVEIANKIYVMQGNEFQENFKALLTNKFFSSIDAIDFLNNNEAAQTINSWVEWKTNNTIKDLVSADSLNADIQLLLINAIHFKGNWVHLFNSYLTREQNFYVDETNKVKVQMMQVENVFNYGMFRALDATALEMPYRQSNISMLIILPNSRTGLADLEKKLRNHSLKDLIKKMYPTDVTVHFPKFESTYDAELSEPLINMGMGSMFSQDAEFGKLLKGNRHIKVSKVIHKAVIEVDENGTEAAAATAIDAVALSDGGEYFRADHGFFYAILYNREIVLFQGRQTFL